MYDTKDLLSLGQMRQLSHQIKPGDHLVHFYDDTATLVDCVCDYVVPGLTRGEGVILVTTAAHAQDFIRALEERAIDVSRARAMEQIIFLDAREVLGTFMFLGSPDPQRFQEALGPVLDRMLQRYPRVKGFGEMVDLLWESGNVQGTLELEALWCDLVRSRPLSLLCAYSAKDQNHKSHSLGEVCGLHSHVISPDGNLRLMAGTP